ncbi:hypothetical protein C2E23DRAFT_819256 [Lenzites betulinus]|nr:hypothetical protein C2E23DRAFT_819256 [Lenzites betulinus]
MSVMTNADTNKGVAPSETVPGEKSEKRLLVELKHGKLVLRQKILAFEKMSETMQEIVKFREMLEQRLETNGPPLTEISDEHKPVFAKLVQESDKTFQALSKHVQQQLLPAVDEDEEEDTTAPILPLETVEDVIKSLATRVNYGLDNPVEGGRVPAGWHIWRWEVSDEYRSWLPKNAKEKVENRWKERQQAKNDVRVLFEALPEDERNAILGSKPGAKAAFKVKTGAKGIPGTAMPDLTDVPVPVTPQLPQPKATSENDAPEPAAVEDGESPDKKGVGRPKKPVDPEKAAERAVKEKERLEKKAAKAEREKKELAAQAKSRSLMANFFGKAKPAASSSASPSKSNTAREGANGSPAPVTVQTDYQRAFRPFALKKDAELAPVNWFRESKRQERRRQRHRSQGDIIVLDDDEDDNADEDVEMADAQDVESLHSLSHPEQIHYILSRLPHGLNPPRRPRQPTGYKTYWPISVRGLMTQLNEAEVAGDDNEVRRLLALLRSRRALPAKAIVFTEDARPGYFGTFTRSSREVGPRTPFARDVVAVDYGYDSGAEWAEEDAGEADDVVEGDGEDEDPDDGDPDSDLDSWLVDDDEVEDPGTPIEERPGTPEFEFPPAPQPAKRKKEKEKEREAEKERGGASKKRRVVVPLVPFSKGPEWENVLGKCRYKPFKQYQIQLFNDTPFPIDPFTFVSQPVEKASAEHHAQHTADGFVIPALPPHIAKSSSSIASSGSAAGPSPSSSSTSLAGPSTPSTKRGGLTPKTAFPDAHIPHLLARIDALETSSLHCIVETVYRELQAHRVKKNAIEAKVREVGEKSKERKVWIVRPEVKAQHGIA